MQGNVDFLRLLGYFQAAFDVIDNQGMTPLHRAASAGQFDSSMHLAKERGLDPAAETPEGLVSSWLAS
jgi:ankyrin repeat protein